MRTPNLDVVVLNFFATQPAQRADIADNVLSGRKTGAEMARLYKVSQPTVSRIISEYQTETENSANKS